MEWRTDTVQAVAFTMPGSAQPDALKIWATLAGGASPESFNRPTGAPNAITNAFGVVGEDRVQVTSQLGRIDLIVQGTPTPDGISPPRISDPKAVSDRLSGHLLRSLSDAPCFRLALTASLSMLLDESADPAYRLKEISGAPFPATGKDLSFQYNLQKPFASDPSVIMNRLYVWASGYQQLITMGSNQSGPGAGPGVAFQVQSIPLINFRADLNSATDPNALIASRAAGFIEEMSVEMRHIFEIGPEKLP